MSLGLGRSRALDPGVIGVRSGALPALPDRLDDERALAAARVDPRAWFPKPGQPLEIEIGPGKGAFLVEQASAHPDRNYLGIEQAGEFWAYVADRCRRRQLSNVRVLFGDAASFLHWRAPDAVAEVIHLYFSDPWPKNRHHKRRVVQDDFLADAWRVLTPTAGSACWGASGPACTAGTVGTGGTGGTGGELCGGELRIVTDHDDYWAWMEEHFARWCDPSRQTPRFERAAFAGADRPASAGAGELVGTNFERKYAREGRQFHAVTLRKFV